MMKRKTVLIIMLLVGMLILPSCSLFNTDEGATYYYGFTAYEEEVCEEYVGFVIPFFPTYDYFLESYESNGYRGIKFGALCTDENYFQVYLNEVIPYEFVETWVDDDGQTNYVYKNEGINVFVWYNAQASTMYVDAGYDFELLSNEGAGLPEDDGSGIYNVNFRDGKYCKDVTEQSSYMGDCPPTGASGVLVIPVEFSDRRAESLGYTIDNIKNIVEKDGKNDYVSLYDYYYTSSLQKLTLDIKVVEDWFCPSNPSTYYYETEDGAEMVMNEALAHLDEAMDLSKFDSDANGCIDAIMLVTTLEIESGYSNFYWAYENYNFYKDENNNYYKYDDVHAGNYVWMSYAFMHDNPERDDYSDTSILNPETFIHEFAHVIGADDYYDTAYVDHPIKGHDIMDNRIGDHNPYTKFNYGWITSSRLVVTDSSITLKLEDFSQNGDTIILANNWDPELGVYQEYYILAYYNGGPLNSGMGGLFDKNGIVVYHINATLYAQDTADSYYEDIYNNNTHPSELGGTENNLLELVTNGDEPVYGVGDTLMTVVDDCGVDLGYTFIVDELNETEAIITVNAK